ncbi:MAG TPA: 16S rRNA (cytidine(1402)-2'-O)-methyltransferase [Chloroflexota bacterium]|nr:16S rRNA (cytidine(1402)-2'-O)-methyltransferase [Chloroflexota bacterium]
MATPIGNLEDMTYRAVRILREVSLVAAEDTRVTRKLFAAHDIHTPLASFHEFTSPTRRTRLVDRLREGDLALVTDAGTPGISDPGYVLVRDTLVAGYEVVPVPGASSLLAALVASGLPMHAFCFVGFLPRTTAQRRKLLSQHADDPHTLVALESPHRLVRALQDIVASLGPERPLAVARELTKKFEEIFRGTAAEALAHFQQEAPRGEFTLVIGA